MAAWPSTVPHEPLGDSFQIAEAGATLLASEMQSGRVRYRRQFTLRRSTMQITLRMTQDELVDFSAFLYQTLNEGADTFTMPIWQPSIGSFVNCEVQIQGGANGVTARTVDPEGNLIDVSFTAIVYGHTL